MQISSYGLPTVVKFIETENRIMVAREWRKEEKGVFFFNAFLFFIEFKFCKRKRVLGNTLVIQGLGLQLSLPREDLDLIPGRELRSRRQCGEAKRNKTKRALEMVGGDGCTAI